MATPAQEVLLSVRRSAGLTQAELARRAGIPRSVLNAYERGTREPGANALAAIASSAGQRLATSRATTRLDAQRAARILEQVLDLAEHLPFKRRRGLPPSPFRPVAGRG